MEIFSKAGALATTGQPILWLGVAGFAPDERASIANALERSGSLPRWRTCKVAEADAALVHGQRASLPAAGRLCVMPGIPGEQTLVVDLGKCDKPLAFSTPLAAPDLKPRCTFDVASRASIQGVLLQFETSLRLARTEFVLGSQIIRLGAAKLRGGVFHLMMGGTLVAVLDFANGKAGISARAYPADLQQAEWHRRPAGAGSIPPGFLRTTPAQVAWSYVRRAGHDALPQRYRAQTIYYRGAPKVPMQWLQDSQQMILRELAQEPCTLGGLRQRTGLSAPQVEHDLTCLYFASAITTTTAKAGLAAGRYDMHPPSSGQGMDSLLQSDSAVPTQAPHDSIIPAPCATAPRGAFPVRANAP